MPTDNLFDARPRAAPLHAAIVACMLALSLVSLVPVSATETVPDPAQARGPVTSLPLPRYVSTRAASSNARRGPSLDQRIDWEFVRRGLPLEITAEYGQWRRVRDAFGEGGWMHHSLISGVRTVLVSAEAPLPLRTAATEDAAVRAMAEPGVVARLEECTGTWCRIATEDITGWLPQTALWGVSPGETVD